MKIMRIGLKHFIALIIGIVFLSNLSSFAQRRVAEEYASPIDPGARSTPTYIGPAVGINIMGHSMNLPTFVGDNLCPNFKNATGIGIFAGFTLEYMLGEDKSNSSTAIIGRVLFNMYPGSVTVEEKDYPVRAANGSVINTNVENVLDIDYNVITVEAVYKINPIEGFGIGFIVGPAFDFAISKNRTHNYNLVSPSNAQFLANDQSNQYPLINNNRTRVMYDGEIEDAGAFRLGLKAGVQYEILLNSKFYIVPSVTYNFGITSVTGKYDWRVSPLQIGVDARYAW
jgi:hypothetical protein